MYRNIVIGGVTAAVIVGAGTTALATTGSDTTAGTNSTASTTASTSSTSGAAGKGHGGHGKHGKGDRKLLGRLEHGQFVTRAKSGTVTHDLIRGTVTAVSATSITVQAADKTSETFVVGKDTKVRVRQDGKGASSSISSVAKGDHVFVAGTGTSTMTAMHVVDVKGKK